MSLMPARVKHRKQQRGNRAGIAWSGATVAFGEYGLQSLGRDWITAVQIEACRVALSRNMKRRGKLWIRIFPDKPVSAKPLETRMGKGKGEPEAWVAVVKPGTVLFEIGGVDELTAKGALRRIAAKMPVRCRMAYRRHGL